MIDGLQLNLTVRVSDVDAAMVWYEEVFDVAPLYVGVDRSLSGMSEKIACFRLGGVKLWLSKRSTEDVHPIDGDAGPGIAFLARKPLAPIRARLIERGAIVRDGETKPGFPADENGVRQGKDAEFFYIYDPDGNRFEFCRVFLRDQSLISPSR